MVDGTISGNSALQSGGGVFVSSSSSFVKTSGTIFGYTFGLGDSNVVEGILVLNNKGHAVYVGYSVIEIHKETDAGPEVNLLWSGGNPPTFNGGWEY